MNKPTRRAVLAGTAGIAAATAVGVTPDAAAHHPDAALLDLGHALDARWNAEPDADDAALDALVRETGAIVDRIIASTATTFQGFAVKARAVTWCIAGGENALQAVAHERATATTTDERVLWSLLADLLAAAGGGNNA